MLQWSWGKEHKSWWDREVKEAVTKRKGASKVHRFYKKLSSNFPEVVPTSVVREKWEEYEA